MAQGEAAVELYQDDAGGLYIFREDEESGFYMSRDVPGPLFEKDAQDIARGPEPIWRLDLPGANRNQALRVGAVHVATWEGGEVTVHSQPNSKARMYLGRG